MATKKRKGMKGKGRKGELINLDEESEENAKRDDSMTRASGWE